ncbi:MAG: diguanylate cyclase [Chromatiales bacterium]|nr:diguanylate cyclase [Chromatiales bacterium]
MNADEEEYTILTVDDNASNINILIEMLADRYDILVALDGNTALEIAREERVDLILLDIVMPVMTGFDVCQTLKQDPATRDIPVIFLTAKTDDDSIEKAYAVGGIDYVVKPFRRVELSARIRTQLHLRTLMKDLEYLANHDPLTGVYNRRRFFELATALYGDHSQVCAAMIDIDNFKSINDAYGHPVGDEVIRLTAQTIGKHLDDDVIFGRIGGEEFALVSPKKERDRFFHAVEDIRNAFESIVVPGCEEPIQFRISCGVAEKSDRTHSVDGLLRHADEALYQAKTRGKNRTIRLQDRDDALHAQARSNGQGRTR